eukprot:4488594-Prymnesium_polylepis.1
MAGCTRAHPYPRGDRDRTLSSRATARHARVLAQRAPSAHSRSTAGWGPRTMRPRRTIPARAMA